MRGKAGQGDARKSKRVDPDIAYLYATLDRLDKRAIERCVVRHDRAAADELPECRHGLHGRGGVCHVRVGNARQFGYFSRYKARWMHKRVKGIDNLASSQARSRNLDELAVLQGEPRGFGVEHDHVVFDQRKIARLGALLERGIRFDHKCRRARHHRFFD